MNCKPLKDITCNFCLERSLCRTFLGLKKLDEYSNVEPVKYNKKIEWNNGEPIIATARRNPILGIEIETNVLWSSIPAYIQDEISTWAKTDGAKKMRVIVDNVGVVKTFGGKNDS